MATKKFVIEVEKGRTECEMCPYMAIKGLGCSSVQVLNCTMYDLSTMEVKPIEESVLPLCYSICEIRNPNKPMEEKK